MPPTPVETEQDIQRLIDTGKSRSIDWFKDDTPIPRIALTLAAMANSAGGILIVGVGPTGMIEGVRDTDHTIDQVLQATLSLEPKLIIPMPRVHRVTDHPLVVVKIPPGMPNVYSLDGRYVHRHDRQNIGLKPSELRRLIIERGVTSFEVEVHPTATLNDIDWERARAYARTLSIVGEHEVRTLLERRGCLTQYNGSLSPTNAGMLLFGRDPQRFLRGSDITAARFAGDTMGDIFNREDITGTLPDQIRRAETFLADHLRKGILLGSRMERTEQLEYPMEAARELVVNAVAHRDYSIEGDGIRLFLFRDHMNVSSPGGLAGPVTVDNIKDERFSRNPVIVQILADMGFIERLGYGVDRVIDLMQAQGMPKPTFEETDGGFRVTLYRAPERSIIAYPPSSVKHPVYAVDKMNAELNPRQEIAVAHLRQAPNSRLTNSKLQSLCPDVHAETLRRDLADLVNQGVLVKRGQKRGSYYMLKPYEDSNNAPKPS